MGSEGARPRKSRKHKLDISYCLANWQKLRDTFNLGDAAIFGPVRMYQYLTPHLVPGAKPPADWDPAVIPDKMFPPERVFCLVGTNPQDYEVALGLSSKAAGVRSDGLAQVDNAFVPGANRALVHRSRSGRYGLANSEEGYQNLWRFLFGDLRVDVELVNLNLPGTPRRRHLGSWTSSSPSAACRSLSTNVDERPAGADSLRYALHVRLLSIVERTGLLDFTSHLEQTADFDDTFVVDLKPNNGALSASATWTPRSPVRFGTLILTSIRLAIHPWK